ncbi:hypothetical protein [Sphaerimonospora thailandensis]|uniref:RNA polymerase sigma-70 factor (ECF subfamily) n=1 Tax=Sphaerimonospora thailandensis TaxID=795644 RepID=A0A8J3R337_9ACTN|nr:hypothetical protein [Sphaerimonospora thailandensis]GIH68261.1 hypothetical protein Mth01_05140 [Sphaerimonospora thailandensis]
MGAVVAPRGRLLLVLRFAFDGERISAIDVTGDPAHLRRTWIGVIRGPLE